MAEAEDSVGNVYVYNLFPESITQIVLNSQPSAGTIAAPAAAAPYTPASLAIPRGPANSAPILQKSIFQQDANSIQVNVLEQSWSGNLFIDPTLAPALVNDMLLYLALVADKATGNLNGLMLLFSTQGQLIALDGPGGTGILKSTSTGSASAFENRENKPPLG